MKLSIIIPVYNEEGAIESLVDDLGGVLTHLFPEFEVIVVDDASTDGTPASRPALSTTTPSFST